MYRLQEARGMTVLSDKDLIELQASILFQYDANGRMLSLNEPDPEEPAPRLFLGRTAAGSIWRFRYDLPDTLSRELERLLRTEPPATDLSRPPQVLPALIDTLEGRAPIHSISAGPAYRFPSQIEPPEGVVAVSHTNVDILRRHYPYTAAHLEVRQPCMALIANGDAVSLCFCARLTPGGAEAGVDTVEAYRRRGYAAAVVAAWAIAVRESNRVPLYSTDWDNHASQAVARKLGLVMYGANMSIM